MIRTFLAVVLGGVLSLPASAATLRVDVTGSMEWSYLHSGGFDTESDDVVEEGVLSAADVPLGTPGVRFREVADATTGRFFYSTTDGVISRCTGLMAMICDFSSDSPDIFPEEPPVAFDAALDTFGASLKLRFGLAAFEIDPESFLYVGDFGADALRIGSVAYSMAYPVLEGSIDSMTVTAIPVPASVPLLLGGLGVLALLGRRTRRKGTAPRLAQAASRG